jgi:hypothetical protein
MSLTGAEEKAFVTIEISKERISAICMYSVCLGHGTIGRESVYVEFVYSLASLGGSNFPVLHDDVEATIQSKINTTLFY